MFVTDHRMYCKISDSLVFELLPSYQLYTRDNRQKLRSLECALMSTGYNESVN